MASASPDCRANPARRLDAANRDRPDQTVPEGQHVRTNRPFLRPRLWPRPPAARAIGRGSPVCPPGSPGRTARLAADLADRTIPSRPASGGALPSRATDSWADYPHQPRLTRGQASPPSPCDCGTVVTGRPHGDHARRRVREPKSPAMPGLPVRFSCEVLRYLRTRAQLRSEPPSSSTATFGPRFRRSRAIPQRPRQVVSLTRLRSGILSTFSGACTLFMLIQPSRRIDMIRITSSTIASSLNRFACTILSKA